MKNLMNYPLLVFVISFVLLWLSARIGASVLRRRHALKEDVRDDFGVILAATLTLLGLIIGFSFSMAISRYDQRKIYEEEEANAIGTEYVRADLLPAADAARVQHAARELSRSAHLVLYDPRRGAPAAGRRRHGPTAGGPVVRGRGPGGGAADAHRRPGGLGHERRPQLAGIHAGRVVEPHSDRRMGADAGDRRLLQPAGRLWRAQRQGGSAPCCWSCRSWWPSRSF